MYWKIFEYIRVSKYSSHPESTTTLSPSWYKHAEQATTPCCESLACTDQQTRSCLYLGIQYHEEKRHIFLLFVVLRGIQ